MTFTGMGEVDAPIVFAGYGITAPEHEYDDIDIDSPEDYVDLLKE